MKSKDIFYLLIAVVILLGAGYLGYTQLMPKKTADQGVKVEVVGDIPADMDQSALATIRDRDKVVDYSVLIDLTTGLNNAQPFGGQ